MTAAKILICPYCGATQPEAPRCRECAGVFEPLSRQATHNAMGPWSIRDGRRPFQPPCSYETLVTLIERGQVTKNTILRGPTTRQFWTAAKRVPGIAHLFGYCHQCDATVEPTDHGCPHCGAVFGAYLDRDHMGLPEIRPMPWEADIEGGAPARAAFGSRGLPVPGRHLSSFASDEEMLGRTAGRSVAVAPHRSGNGERAGAGDSPGPGPAPAPTRLAGPTDLTGAATRAMQRRLARQERHIRMMTVALGLSAVLVVVLSLVQWRMIAGRSGAGDSGSSTEHPEPSARSESPRPAPQQEQQQQPPAPSIEAAPAQTDAPLDAEPAAEANREWDGKYQEAITLAGTGADKSLERTTRIEAYGKALQILADIATHAPPESRPADLDALTERLARELEQLKLEEFFP